MITQRDANRTTRGISKVSGLSLGLETARYRAEKVQLVKYLQYRERGGEKKINQTAVFLTDHVLASVS